MAYFDFADKYFESRKETHDKIKELSEKRKLNLFGKLLSDKNEINFMSWLSEMKFGLRLDKIFQTLLYDHKINNQTPDWLVNFNGQNLIFEVVRINRHEQELLNKIKEFKNEKSQEKNIIATAKYSGVLDGHYFYGNIDKIAKKEITYRKIIKDKNYSLIICVDSSETDLFTFYNDFLDFFVADGKHGYFNRNISFGKNVSAIFIQVPFDGYKIIVNENCNNKLNVQNLSLIRQMCD